MFNYFLILSVLVLTIGIVWAQSTGSSVSNDDITKFSEELLKKDNSGLSSKVTANKQGKTNSGSATDKAEKPLLTVQSDALKYPTIELLLAMFDNYEPDVKKAEDVTQAEIQEENKFLDALLNTEVMNYTRSFLKEKGLFTEDKNKFKDFLKQTWFTLYSRGHRKKSSSAFEHVFLGELKANEVSGLHNWIFFYNQESKNQLNYLGWMREVNFGKGSIMKLHYKWKDTDKPVGTLFIGTSPEFELSLYTVCYLARPNEKCDFTLNNKPVFIQTYTFNANKQKLIGSAYPGL